MSATDRDVFLAERKHGLGGSDIAAMLGLSPYKTPLRLWMDKTGRDESEPDGEALERMHWGTVLEDIVARHYAETRGVKVQRINQILHHPEVAIAIANVDRFVLDPGKRAYWSEDAGHVMGARNVLEVKTAHALARRSADWGEPGTDEVPVQYWMQCTWYLGITGLPFADLAVLFGGQKFETYTIAFNRAIFDDMLAEADIWWKKHILDDIPPEPSTEDDARRLWKSHLAGKEKIVDATVADAVQLLAETKAGIAKLEKEEQQLRDRITCAFGDAEAISYMGRKLATWKRNKDGQRTNWKDAADQLKGWMIANDIEGGVDAVRDIIDENTTTTEGARVLRLNAKELS